MSRLRLAYHRLRGMKCVHWPCRRCDRAGRTSWRSREAWHKARRRQTWRVLGFGAALALAWALLWLAGWALMTAAPR